MVKLYLKKAALLPVFLFLCALLNAQSTQTVTYNFTGAVQTFTVPSCVSTMTLELRGAAGATATGGTGGMGALAKGVITVSAGQVLNIYVGGQNGYNGGGIGGVNGNSVSSGPSTGLAGSGGGASDIRIGGTALNNRVMVAGGGGGGGNNGTWSACQPASPAGNGGTGGLTGSAGTTGSSFACNCTGGGGNGGGGGTASAGGAAGTYNNIGCLQGWGIGVAGALGLGGNGSTVYYNGTGGGGGGGGGYYGGGAGGSGSDTTPGGGGGGGPSYTGAATNTVVTSGVQSGDGKIILTFDYNGAGVQASASSLSICTGASVTFTSSNVLTYTWSTGSNATNITVSPTANTSYTVYGTNSLGCVSSAILTVTVDPGLPTLTVSASPTSVCAGRTATLTASGATSYTWNNSVSNGTSFIPAATATYVVTGGNACGTSTAATSITVNALPNVGGTASSPTICNGSTVTLNGTGANTYVWSNGVTNNSAFVPSATNQYTVTGISAQGCTNTAVVGITVYITPTVAPVASQTAICLGKTTTLTATGATSGYTWSTVPASNSSIVAVSPTTTTTYTIIRLSAACSSTATITIQVNGLPSVFVNPPSPTVTCAGGATTLSAVGAISYTWYPGGFPGASITVYPNSNTTYTVVGANTNCTLDAVSTVSVNPNPSIIISAQNSSVICAGQSATLTANGASTYTWLTAPNQVQQSITVNPLVSTLYSVSATNNFGCTSIQSQVVIVKPAPNLTTTIVNPGGYICAGSVGTLQAVSQNPTQTSYSWNTGGAASTITVSPTTSTGYTVTATDASSGCQSIGTVSLSVFVSTFVVSSPTAICKGSTATLSASGSATSYTWITGSTVTSSFSISVSPIATANYTVSGTSGNCSTTKTLNLVVNQIPNVTALAARPTICLFEPGVINGSGATSYSWSTGSSVASVTVFPTVTTTYTLTGTDNNGCSKTVNVTQLVSNCTGIAELQGLPKDVIQIYPNPSSGDFTIIAETALNIQLVSETGQLVKAGNLGQNDPFRVASLASGLYFIIAEKDGLYLTKKVVVTR